MRGSEYDSALNSPPITDDLPIINYVADKVRSCEFSEKSTSLLQIHCTEAF
jgi:hypothetical protein